MDYPHKNKSCSACEYSGTKPVGCWYPEPQCGGAKPFMVTFVMPDPSNGGENCFQFRAALTKEPKT